MGTELIDYLDEGDILFKRFWGGDDCGVMYQITERSSSGRYVQCSHDDLLRLCSVFIGSLVGENKL